MSSVQKVSVALTPELIAMVKEAVDTGEDTSASEVVREALRVWKTRRTVQELEAEELRRLWVEGLASGGSVDARPVFKHLRNTYVRHASSK